MTIWTVVLVICWLNAGTLECHTWTGGSWPSVTDCTQTVHAMVVRSGAASYQAICRRRIST